jgi:hypothetical protein
MSVNQHALSKLGRANLRDLDEPAKCAEKCVFQLLLPTSILVLLLAFAVWRIVSLSVMSNRPRTVISKRVLGAKMVQFPTGH